MSTQTSNEEEFELHTHPNPGPTGQGNGRFTVIYGRLIKDGEVLQETDMYSSTSGYWEPCPCPGLTLQTYPGGPVWVRTTEG